MKKRRPAAPAVDHFETASTGHHCPKTGWWSATWNDAAPTFITEGHMMPAVGGVATAWILRQAVTRVRSSEDTLVHTSIIRTP